MAKNLLGAAASAAAHAVTKGELDTALGSATRVYLTEDRVNSNATANTIADITGLEFPVVAGKYWFSFFIAYTSAASTTGARFAVNGPALTTLMLRIIIPTTATAIASSNVTAYNNPTSAQGSAVVAGSIASMEGFIEVSASGSVIARFASEIANSAITVKAGSYVDYFQVP